jgi:hypothetical protein
MGKPQFTASFIVINVSLTEQFSKYLTGKKLGQGWKGPLIVLHGKQITIFTFYRKYLHRCV